MATETDLTKLSDDELTTAFREAEREHSEIRSREPSPLAIIDPDDPAVLTDEMREASAPSWNLMREIALERDRRRTARSETGG